jgi:hypothetical protein
MKAAAVRVDAEREADVRAVVLRQDLPRLILEHLQLHLRRALEVLDLGRGPRIGWVRDRHRLHVVLVSLNTRSAKPARSTFRSRADLDPPQPIK